MKLPAYRSRAEEFVAAAQECGFDLAGVAKAGEIAEYGFFEQWAAAGMAGEMKYLTDRRAALRRDIRMLLPSAKSVLCVGSVYRTADLDFGPGQGRVSSYAWGQDYHAWMRQRLEHLVAQLHGVWGEFESKICVDTAPLLERSVAQAAGLGWIGKNTCLINEEIGSWFFLGEIITSLELPAAMAPPDRCGTCTRCIDACPTDALVATDAEGGPSHAVDSRRCISYLTIELRGEIPRELRPAMGDHLFGCDICQDVCPWNSRSPVTGESAFQPKHGSPDLASSSALTAEEFRAIYRASPVWRAKHQGFLRNVAVAMGNSGDVSYLPILRRMTAAEDAVIREHAEWAISQLQSCR